MIGIATATLMTLVNQVSGTPYVSGGDTPRGTDCSGLASWVANAATGRPIYGDRFHTSNEEAGLLARGFRHGTQPGALNIGWNGGHTAVTLPDGTPVSSGEGGGGVRVGGGGAFQKQFTHHMYLPVEAAEDDESVPAEGRATDPFAPPLAVDVLDADALAPAPEFDPASAGPEDVPTPRADLVPATEPSPPAGT